jgi:hypothetical protein
MTTPFSIRIRDDIFKNNETCIGFMLENKLIDVTCTCRSCGFLMKLQKFNRSTNGFVYRCTGRDCCKRLTLLTATRFLKPKIPLKDYVLAIYCWIIQMTNYQIVDVTEISEPSLILIKKQIINVCRLDIERSKRKLGGHKKVVQVDETAICRSKIILNPTSTIDNIAGTQWMIGIIEESLS